MKFAIKSRNAIIQNEIKEATIIVENGKIEEVIDYNADTGCIAEDYGELIIMPGLTDTHVHINEPGREDWEGFETATKAAIAGGITMLADMPLNSSPVTIDTDSLNKKIESAKNKLYCDTGFYGGLIPGNVNELRNLIKGGVLGLKAFMIDSGIEDFPNVTEDNIRNALKVLKADNATVQNQIPLLVHAELNCGYNIPDDYSPNSFKSFIDKRPEEWEYKAVEMLIKLCREYDYHIHIVHVSTAASLELITNAKKEGLRLTVETCPHYLYFSSEEIPDSDTRFKCTPPIRGKENREKLWQAVSDGTIDFIASDHSPCNPELKFMEEGNFEKAWGGISGLQFSLAATWTEARKRGISILTITELMCEKTSEFLKINNFKGKIAKGYDADLVIFNPEKKFMVEEDSIFHRHKVTPYTGKELTGAVECTYLRGEKVFEKGKIISCPIGRVILGSEIKSFSH